MTQDYLKQSFFFFKSNLSSLLAIQLPFIAALIALKHSVVGASVDAENLQEDVLLITSIDVLFVPIYLAATLVYMQSVVEGNPLSVVQTWWLGFRNWFRLFVTFLISAVSISIGLMLLIIPGVYLAVRFAFANAICVIENKGPIDALQSSWHGSAPHFWLLLKGLAIIYGGLFTAELLVAPLVEPESLGSIIAQAFLDFLNIFGAIFTFRVYRAWRDNELPDLSDSALH